VRDDYDINEKIINIKRYTCFIIRISQSISFMTK